MARRPVIEPAPAVSAMLRPLVRELAAQGGLAVWLAGSHARGDASRYSDVDVSVLAAQADAGPGYRLSLRSDFLVSVAWTTAGATRASFRNPAVLGAAVPGWRRAALLHDPDGHAAELRAEALRWTWDDVAAACDAWVAEQVTGLAEEVHKLCGALARGAVAAAAVQRSVLALRLPVVMSVHMRLLYDSENVLWDLVAGAAGPEWARSQAAALGGGGAAALGALDLYILAASAAHDRLDPRQRAVVERARALARERRDAERSPA